MASAPLMQLHDSDSPNHFYLYRGGKSQIRAEKPLQQQTTFLSELVREEFPSSISSKHREDLEVKDEEEERKENEMKDEKKEAVALLEAILHESALQEKKERRFEEEEEEKKKDVVGSLSQNSSLSDDLQLAEKASSQHFYSTKGRLHSACSGDSSKDPEAFSPSAITATTMKSDILVSSPNDNGSISSISSMEVQSVLQSCLANAEIVATKLLQEAMDTVQSQVLCALQQAANETFDNLKKNAAHRIVMAEQRATTLEQELSMVKQHALMMLLRLKTDTDAKVLEMEKRYLAERRRAQDAEAKLITAQDTSKRLKLELRKKREVIEKMQKLVQPISGDHQQTLKGMSDTSVACGGNFLRDEIDDMNMQSPKNKFRPNMENYSLHAFNQIAHQDIHYAVVKPDVLMGTATSTEDGRKLIAETVKDEEKMELHIPTNSLIERVEDASVVHTEDAIPENKEERPLFQIGSTSTDHVETVDQSNRMTVIGPKAMRDHTKTNHKHKDWVDSSIECFETTTPLVLDEHPNLGDENFGSFRGSDSSIKGIYVRRKDRMRNEQYAKKENNGLAVVKPCPSMKEGIHSSGFTVLREMELQPKVETGKGDEMVDVPMLPADALQIKNSAIYKKNEVLEEKLPGNVHGNGSETNLKKSRNESLLKSVELARPDYEVATSLTELAFLGQDLQSHQIEMSPSMRREDVFIKPGRTGLRMKRMGVSFQRNVSSGVGRKIVKKAKLDKDDGRMLEKSSEKRLKRTRIGKSTTTKDGFSVESSRDSRRLLQGARQLLCLAEKKWE